MAADMFLKLDGIKGESLDSKHKDEIEIHSFQFGVHQTGTGASGGGSGAGKASFSDFTIVKSADSSSPLLMVNCATGSHIKTGSLTVRKAGGDQQEYYIIKFNEILISNFTNSGSGDGETPTESVSFNFSKIEFEYKTQKADGTLGGSGKGGWDLKANKKV